MNKKESHYQKLKRENMELKSKSNEILLISDTPRFLFSGEASNEEVYVFLKDHPESSLFLFKQYKANQSFIKNLCDPENPIFIPQVSEYMKDLFAVETVQEDITNLENRQRKLQHEIGLLEEELTENKTKNEKELNDLISEIDTKKSELNTLTSRFQALSTIESMKLLNELFIWTDRRVHDFGDQVPIFDNSRFVPLKSNDFDRFREIIERLKEVMDKNELVPKELIDKMRLEYDRQKEELLIMTTYAMDHDILKVHKKVKDDIEYIFKQINGKNQITSKTDMNSIAEYMDKAVKRLDKWDADVPNTTAMLK